MLRVEVYVRAFIARETNINKDARLFLCRRCSRFYLLPHDYLLRHGAVVAGKCAPSKALKAAQVLPVFVELFGAAMRSHDSSRQWTFELVEEYGECEE